MSEEEVPLRLFLLTADTVEKPSLVVLTAVDEPGWQEMIGELGPAFKTALQLDHEPKLDGAAFEQNRKALAFNKWAFATVAPRGIGPTRWAEVDSAGKPIGHQIRRRFALLGQTLDGQRVWDIRRAVAALRTVADVKGAPLWLQGKGDMAGLVLYAALFEPDIAQSGPVVSARIARSGPDVPQCPPHPRHAASSGPGLSPQGAPVCQGRRRSSGLGLAVAIAAIPRPAIPADPQGWAARDDLATAQ